MKTTTQKLTSMRTTPKNMFLLLMAVVFALGIILTACEGPSGSQGPQGPDGQQGPEGPIGPAGEDGSVMYAGEGAPAADIGQNGDYYLNQNTGELYGPKDGEGWGNSIIVLMGEDGQDGQNGDDGQDGADGQDGQDGEDGSQIYSGSGTPGGSLGSAGDYYLDQDNYELYGPKTGSGWGTPLNLKGADGNANVTQYIFGEHDFSAGSSVSLDIPGTTVEEMYQSAWLVYLVRSGGNVYSVPGWAVDGLTEYRSYLLHMPANNGTARIVVTIKNGSGEVYAEMRVVRVLANSTEGLSKQKENSIIPDHLDVSDYEAVAEYYGFYR